MANLNLLKTSLDLRDMLFQLLKNFLKDLLPLNLILFMMAMDLEREARRQFMLMVKRLLMDVLREHSPIFSLPMKLLMLDSITKHQLQKELATDRRKPALPVRLIR